MRYHDLDHEPAPTPALFVALDGFAESTTPHGVTRSANQVRMLDALVRNPDFFALRFLQLEREVRRLTDEVIPELENRIAGVSERCAI